VIETMTNALPLDTPLALAPDASVALVRTSALGDVVQSWALLRWLADQRPAWHRYWLVSQAAEPLVACLPHHLVTPLPVPKRWAWRGPNPLATAGINLSIDTQGLYKSAWWAWAAKVPIRLGAMPAREWVGWAYTHTVGASTTATLRHNAPPAVWEHSQLLLPLGCAPPCPEALLPSLWPELPPEHEAWSAVSDRVAALPRLRPWVALAPATTWASKHWPAEYWAVLIAKLLQQGYVVVALGSASEASAINQLANLALGSPPPPGQVGSALDATGAWLNLAGQLSLEATMALLPRCHALVGQDSFLLHLGDAYNRSALPSVQADGSPSPWQRQSSAPPLHLVGLYGPTALSRTGPLWPEAKVLTSKQPCQPCHQRQCPLQHQACLSTLDPLVVLTALADGLALPGIAASVSNTLGSAIRR
jgi:ADP-heptose:LPS heptosyltransferase